MKSDIFSLKKQKRKEKRILEESGFLYFAALFNWCGLQDRWWVPTFNLFIFVIWMLALIHRLACFFHIAKYLNNLLQFSKTIMLKIAQSVRCSYLEIYDLKLCITNSFVILVQVLVASFQFLFSCKIKKNKENDVMLGQ